VPLSAKAVKPFREGRDHSGGCPCPKCGKCVGDDLWKLSAVLLYFNDHPRLVKEARLPRSGSPLYEVMEKMLVAGIEVLSKMVVEPNNALLWSFVLQYADLGALKSSFDIDSKSA
jgi:hypothetical protein